MKKDTIILHVVEDDIEGYVYREKPTRLTESAQLEAIVDWSHTKLGSIIYKHILRFESVPNGKIYAYFFNGEKISKERYDKLEEAKSCLGIENRVYAVNYCTTTYYLDIYYQDA